MSHLSAEQVAQFEEQGYLIVEQLLDQVTPDPGISLGRQKRDVDDSNLVVQPGHVKTACAPAVG